jgi:hypothetical protein
MSPSVASSISSTLTSNGQCALPLFNPWCHRRSQNQTNYTASMVLEESVAISLQVVKGLPQAGSPGKYVCQAVCTKRSPRESHQAA